MNVDISLAQLEEMMLPKAIEYFQQNIDAFVYQVLWKSKHGTKIQSTRRVIRGEERL
jgi:hypothetical protein